MNKEQEKYLGERWHILPPRRLRQSGWLRIHSLVRTIHPHRQQKKTPGPATCTTPNPLRNSYWVIGLLNERARPASGVHDLASSKDKISPGEIFSRNFPINELPELENLIPRRVSTIKSKIIQGGRRQINGAVLACLAVSFQLSKQSAKQKD